MNTTYQKSIFFLTRHKVKVSILVVVLIVWWFSLPRPLFDVPISTIVKSREGRLIGGRIATDGQWRFPVLDSIPNRFEKSILYFEDEYFHYHLGFNPISMTKALWNNLSTSSRRGGSTISQQVIRLARQNKRRTYFEKGIELLLSVRMEVSYSKKEILNLYASNAPFGGNVVGLETAAWRYFGLPASDLSWGQSAALAVLPNAPSLVFPGKNEPILKEKRDRLLHKLYENEVIDSTTLLLSLEERLPGKAYALPQHAPHLTELIKQQQPTAQITSTIDYSLQKQINQLVKQHHASLKQNEINNISVLLLDVTTKEVLAYVGNAPTDKTNNNFVNVVNKSRSTGSVLKPFLYASALESGDILPHSLLPDVPTSINSYKPHNFDKKYNGAVPASEALTRSLNIPAVHLLQRYGLRRFHRKLQKLGFKRINKSPDYYGLPLILGGAESSLWEITNAYASMASSLKWYNGNGDTYRSNEFTSEPTYVLNQPTDFGHPSTSSPLSAASIYHTLETLKGVNRPQQERNWEFFNHTQPLAWKTGTSFGFKDAWSVGVTSKYAIGVWVGNADGEGRPGITGIESAAPILFDVLNVLPKSAWFKVPYKELRSVDVCEVSGDLASINCPTTSFDLISIQGMHSTPCAFHKSIIIDQNVPPKQVNSSCEEVDKMIPRKWFVLPPVQAFYYSSLHPEYQTLPPFKEGCTVEEQQPMAFIFPKKRETIILPKNFETSLNDVVLKVAHRDADAELFWYLDDRFIGSTTTFHELAIQPKQGAYRLVVVDKKGNEIVQKIDIEVVSE